MEEAQLEDPRSPRSSSAVLRAAAIINFMAEHPNHAFTMIELVRAVKLSQSTCHSLLNALVSVGYLYRTTERTYVLGPSLASIGRIAVGCFSALQIAHPEMRRLADRFDVACSATFREGAWSVVRDRATSARKLGGTAELGIPLRLRAPLSALYFAWRPDEAAEWLASAAVPDHGLERTTLERDMAVVRAYGFAVFLKNNVAAATRMSAERLFEGSLDDLPFRLAGAIDEGESYDVSSIAAPVLDRDGHVEFMISMRGFDGRMAASDIMERAQELKSACGRVSSFCGAGHEAVAYSHV